MAALTTSPFSLITITTASVLPTNGKRDLALDDYHLTIFLGVEIGIIVVVGILFGDRLWKKVRRLVGRVRVWRLEGGHLRDRGVGEV